MYIVVYGQGANKNVMILLSHHCWKPTDLSIIYVPYYALPSESIHPAIDRGSALTAANVLI